MPDTDTICRRVEALRGTIVGRRAKVDVPYAYGTYAEVGTVSAVAYPTIEIDTGGGRSDTVTLITSNCYD